MCSDYNQPLPQNTEDVTVLKPLTSNSVLRESHLELSPCAKPLTNTSPRGVRPNGSTTSRKPLTLTTASLSPGLGTGRTPRHHTRKLDYSPVTMTTTVRKSRATLLWLIAVLAFFSVLISPVTAHEYDATGKKITFFPNAMMYATNPKVLIFYNDTKFVNIHTDLNAFPRGQTPKINITCDSVQADFYRQVLDSVRGIQRTTHRLLSIPRVTNFLECDSFLRRHYQYETGLPSQLFCTTRHFESNLHECKSWAARSCRVTSSDELTWLRTRERRSPFMCHMGVFGLFRAMYKLFTGKSCDSSVSTPLVKVLHEAGKSMTMNQPLTHVVNGKVVYLIKTTDVLSSKIKQLISSLRAMDTTFHSWNKQINYEINQERCHYQANMEFISLYSLQVNRAMSSILRLQEIDDVLRQMSHITRKTVISFADLPRFLTAALEIRLAKIPSMVHTIAALKAGYSTILEPLVDYEFAANKKMQLSLLFTLPEISSQAALCSIEQLIPITYQHNGRCFGGPFPRTDLSLLTCGIHRYVLKSTELEQCSQDDTTILCPANVLTTVKEPKWLGLPWTPNSRLQFKQTHQILSHCKQLRPMILLGGRYYLATVFHNITLTASHAVHHLFVADCSVPTFIIPLVSLPPSWILLYMLLHFYTSLACSRCGTHAPHVLCFPPDVMDGASHDIFLGLLDGNLDNSSRPTLAHVLDVAEYLLLEEEYLEQLIARYLPNQFSGAWLDPTFLLSIRDLYSTGYQSLAKTLYILWDCCNPRLLSEALTMYPDSFADTDLFLGLVIFIFFDSSNCCVVTFYK